MNQDMIHYTARQAAVLRDLNLPNTDDVYADLGYATVQWAEGEDPRFWCQKVIERTARLCVECDGGHTEEEILEVIRRRVMAFNAQFPRAETETA